MCVCGVCVCMRVLVLVLLLVLSAHTLRELEGAPQAVKDRLFRVPPAHQVILQDSEEAFELADAYLAHGVVGPGSRADA